MSDACCSTDHAHNVAATRPPPVVTPIDVLRQHSRELIRLAAAGAAIGLGALIGWLGRPEASLALFLLAIALCIPGPAKRAWSSASRRVLDINVLMVVAVAGAGALGEWFEAA